MPVQKTKNNNNKTTKTKQKKTGGFQISHFCWSFSSDNMAVKGLM